MWQIQRGENAGILAALHPTQPQEKIVSEAIVPRAEAEAKPGSVPFELPAVSPWRWPTAHQPASQQTLYLLNTNQAQPSTECLLRILKYCLSETNDLLYVGYLNLNKKIKKIEYCLSY